MPQNTLKTLGFEKTAGKFDSAKWFAKFQKSGPSAASRKEWARLRAVDKAKKAKAAKAPGTRADVIGDTVSNVMHNVKKVEKPLAKLLHDTGIVTTPGHQKRMESVQDILNMRRARAAAKAKPEVKKPLIGWKTGVGIGAVGATAAHSIFGDKKRNSPYYPSGY